MIRIGLWIFFHLLGMALWLGGMLALSLWTSRARRAGDLRVVAFAYATANRLYRTLIAAGAWVTIVAGAILMFVTSRPWFQPFPEHWLFQMQVFGLIAFLVTLFYVIPNAGALAALAGRAAEEGEEPPEFRTRVKRQAIAGSGVGLLLIYCVLLGGLRF